jgi:alkanesulfonate monooxygenase SsuD/methylene tetrahydromethanopterin reductase-like flavin-dependent oxidoreductase (luciferase family)
MRLGTSLRFMFPTSPETLPTFQRTLAAAPPGTFLERPMGAFDTGEQGRNLLEVAAAARSAGLDGLLWGDNHAMSPAYASVFQPIPTLARITAVTGDMPVGFVLLAPFYHPLLLAEQVGTICAFTEAPFILTFALGGNARAFQAYGMDLRTRVGRLEELVPLVRRLLAGERETHQGRYYTLNSATIAPLPRQPVSIWIAGTVGASVERAGRLGDGWLTAQNASPDQLRAQLELYLESAARHGRPALPVLRRDVYVGESDAEAREVVDAILAEGYRGAGYEALLVGGPESIVQQLREYRAMGFEYVMVRHIVGDHRLMLRSFERIGAYVMPAIRGL